MILYGSGPWALYESIGHLPRLEGGRGGRAAGEERRRRGERQAGGRRAA